MDASFQFTGWKKTPDNRGDNLNTGNPGKNKPTYTGKTQAASSLAVSATLGLVLPVLAALVSL